MTDFFGKQRTHQQRSQLLYRLFFAVIFGHFLVACGLLWLVLLVLLHFDAEFSALLWATVISAVVTVWTFGWGSFQEYQRLKLGGRAVAKYANAKRLFIDSEPLNWQNLPADAPKIRLTEQSMIVQDARFLPPAYQRYIEFANQMAIASGVALPALYVLPHEYGINAFVAGHTASDTVIVVSQGALEKLSDNALYGLVAHEFGHILHGDASFNIKMSVVMAGLNMGYDLTNKSLESNQKIPYQTTLMADSWSDISKRQNQLPLGSETFDKQQWVNYWKKNATAVEQYQRQSSWAYDAEYDSDGSGNVLILPAMVGNLLFASSIFFGKKIKHYFGIQREFLADATSMQLTRSNAIIDTLKAIQTDSIGSQLYANRLAQFNHFYFADSQNRPATALTSHPSLAERLQKAKRQRHGGR